MIYHSLTNLEISEEDLYDEWCDPTKPRVLQFEEIAAAAYRIKYGVPQTPCTVGTFPRKFSRTSLIFLALSYVKNNWHGFIFQEGLLIKYW